LIKSGSATASSLNSSKQTNWKTCGTVKREKREERKKKKNLNPISHLSTHEGVEAFGKLDFLGPDKKGPNGTELDQFWSAKFLEDNDKAITALERKAALKEIDKNNNGKMALIEYLLWKFKKTTATIANASQGDNSEEIARCQARIAEVQAALEDVLRKIEAQKAALREVQDARAANEQKLAAQKVAVQEATSAVIKAKAATEALQRAEQELKDAVAALEAEQKAYNDKCSALEQKIADPSTSGMQKSKAQNELAQLKSEDPLPLRRAKITAEAALRKAEKQRKVSEEAQRDCEAKKAAAAQAERDLEEAGRKLAAKERQLEIAVQELEVAFNELSRQQEKAQAALEEASKSGGAALGAIWFMERQLYAQDAFLPTARMKYDHKKPFKASFQK
jgi:chromosome segregation ATPase